MYVYMHVFVDACMYVCMTDAGGREGERERERARARQSKGEKHTYVYPFTHMGGRVQSANKEKQDEIR